MFAWEPVLFTDMELQTAVCAALTVCFISWMHTPLGHIITETCACIDLRYKPAVAIIDPVQKFLTHCSCCGNRERYAENLHAYAPVFVKDLHKCVFD